MSDAPLKLLLDAHVSGKRVGTPFRADGYDVLALDEARIFDGLSDAEIMQMAAKEGRILIMFNFKDFIPILREWSGSGLTHAGCIIIHGIRQDEFGLILRGIRDLLQERPTSDQWRDIVLVLAR